MSALFQLIRADFLERTRQYSFLGTLGLTFFAAYLALPAANANYFVLKYYQHRGVYTSAWVGMVVAIVTAMFIPLLGFFLVKNSVERDRQTGVGQILASTRLTRCLYILGKALSNFVVLLVIVGILAASAGFMQWMLGEDRIIDFKQLVTPFLWIVLPSILVVSALAVLFEIIPWLRGGFGNVIYFFLYTVLLEQAMDSRYTQDFNLDLSVPALDIFGVSMPFRALFQAFEQYYPAGYKIRIEMFGPGQALQTVFWEGVPVTPEIIAQRLTWVALAGLIAAIAILLFKRFDPGAERLSSVRFSLPFQERFGQRPVNDPAPAVDKSMEIGQASSSPDSPGGFSPAVRRLQFLPLYRAELLLMVNRLPWSWWLVAGALWVTSLFSSERVLLPMVWAWPLLLWSAMGTRESQHNTSALLFSGPRLLTRQVPALWLAGISITAGFGSGVALHMLFTGNWSGLVAWAAAVLFIPSLALCCGVWSGNSKLFEVLYLLLWFLGAVKRDYWFIDFMGLSEIARLHGMPIYVLVVSIGLIALIVFKRTRRLI